MNSAFTSLPLPAGLRSSPAPQTLRPGRAVRIAQAVWQALERAGQARARNHILEFAARCEAHQPDLARELRAAAAQGPML